MKTIKTAIILFTVPGVLTVLLGAVRFTDNHDGTVTDHGTELVWQKCSYGQRALDCAGTAQTYNWMQALQYCRNLTLNGRNWRLPNINELGSIIDYNTESLAIDTFFFPATVSSRYWSSSTVIIEVEYAWSVDFYDGNSDGNDKSSLSYVRCVSDGP